jgi:hypothetical protein
MKDLAERGMNDAVLALLAFVVLSLVHMQRASLWFDHGAKQLWNGQGKLIFLVKASFVASILTIAIGPVMLSRTILVVLVGAMFSLHLMLMAWASLKAAK